MTSPIDGMVLVYIPEGEFLSGVGEGPIFDLYHLHKVFLDAYWIDSTEVTNAMFIKFVSETGYRSTQKNEGDLNDWLHPNGQNSSLIGIENHPVVYVTLADATAYCSWAGRRLPTQAEWEKAARGTDGRMQPWGEGLDCSMANIPGCGITGTVDVATYPIDVSPYGAFDMAGNVTEHVSDGYHEHKDDTPEINPIGPADAYFRASQGGSFFEDFMGYELIAGFQIGSIIGASFIGFRCVMSP